jgi:hypothetical protein
MSFYCVNPTVPLVLLHGEGEGRPSHFECVQVESQSTCCVVFPALIEFIAEKYLF